jgi:hypothetical protein
MQTESFQHLLMSEALEPSIGASHQILVHLASFRKEDFYKSINQKQELPIAAMFVDGSGQN